MASIRSEAVIALGRKLVEHLKLEPDRDLLSGWMAHYLAERMLAVETAPPEARDELEKQCAEAILNVWAHRHRLGTAIPAFADMQALEGAILALAPDRTPFRYFAPLQGAISASQPSQEARQWIELAAGIDDTARELVRHCLRRAADESVEAGEIWLDAAKEALGDDAPERPIISFIRSGDDSAVADLKARLAWLGERARKLDAFVGLSSALAQDLAERVLNAEQELALLEGRPKQKPAAERKRPKP